MMRLVDQWSRHFGWLDNKIDLDVTDLSAFATPDCTITAHAPLYGTRPGRERTMPLNDVRKRLARLLMVGRPSRHDLHITVHPDGTAIAFFARIEIRVAGIGLKVSTIPMTFVMLGEPTDDGIWVREVHEWSAANPAEAAKILIANHGWPSDTGFEPQVAFGAVS